MDTQNTNTLNQKQSIMDEKEPGKETKLKPLPVRDELSPTSCRKVTDDGDNDDKDNGKTDNSTLSMRKEKKKTITLVIMMHSKSSKTCCTVQILTNSYKTCKWLGTRKKGVICMSEFKWECK